MSQPIGVPMQPLGGTSGQPGAMSQVQSGRSPKQKRVEKNEPETRSKF